MARKILVIDLFGHFEEYGFKVFLRSLRAQIGPVNGEGVCRKVLHKLSLNSRVHTSHRSVNQVKKRTRWHRKQCSGS